MSFRPKQWTLRGWLGSVQKLSVVAEVHLRPIRITDAEKCFRWLLNPHVCEFLGLLQPARTLEQERAWIASILADKEHHRAFAIEDERRVAIGTCNLRAIDTQAGTALLGMMIGEPRLWGRGYGTAATRALLSFAFEELNLREVRLACHKENLRGIRCYLRAGFERRSAECDPSPRPHEIQMAITRERWHEIMAADPRTSAAQPTAQ